MEIPDEVVETIGRAIDVARIAKGATKEMPKGLVNDVLAMLCGHISPPKPHAEQLTEAFLGMAIGSMTDLGKTDEYILKTCQTALVRIRAALLNPEIVRDARTLSERIK